MTALLVVGLILALVLLVGNTMLAIAFLKSRGEKLRSSQRGAQDAMDELHRRVEDLGSRPK